MSHQFPLTLRVLEEGIADRLHLGAQLYISVDGQVKADLAIGESRPGVPMTVETINLWMSSGKPITAVAIAQLWEAGRLGLDDPVVRFIPEFGNRGKERITIRHVLTHTGGFRAAIGLSWSDSLEVAVAKICQAALEPRWTPGRTAGYHAATGWYILAEIVRRIEGRPFEQYVRERIFTPTEMRDCWIGMPPEEFERYGERLGLMFETAGENVKPAAAGNSAADAAAVRPGANARGPIRELGRFYETMLQQAGAARLLGPQAIEAMTARHRVGMMDLTFKDKMDFGLGFIINSAHYGSPTLPYGYGKHASPRAFGHSGQESSCGFCDPEHRLVIAWVCNGMPGGAAHAKRQTQLNEAIYSDLNLV